MRRRVERLYRTDAAPEPVWGRDEEAAAGREQVVDGAHERPNVAQVLDDVEGADGVEFAPMVRRVGLEVEGLRFEALAAHPLDGRDVVVEADGPCDGGADLT